MTSLQDLLQFVLQDQGFFSLDPRDIQNGISLAEDRADAKVAIDDAAESTIRIQTAEKEHVVTFYAAGFFARMYPPNLYPETKSLSNLVAVQKTLTRIVEETRAGGLQAIKDALTEANGLLARDFPKVALFTTDDYQRTEFTANGQWKVFYFGRMDASCTSDSVSVGYSQDTKPQVQFSSSPPLPPSLLLVFCGPRPPRQR